MVFRIAFTWFHRPLCRENRPVVQVHWDRFSRMLPHQQDHNQATFR